MSIASRLEHETVGEWEIEERGERLTRREDDVHVEGDECEKSKLKAFVYSCRLGCGESDKPLHSERGEHETRDIEGEKGFENVLGSGIDEKEES